MWPFKRKRDLTLANNDQEIKEKLQKLYKETHFVAATRKYKLEETTRKRLIDYFVAAIGYDMENKNSVRIEYCLSKHNRLDYALFKEDKLISIVEAKKATDTLMERKTPSVINRDHINQIKRYFDNCPSARVIILTNGIKYMFFTRDAAAYASTAMPKTVSEKPFFTLDMSDEAYVNNVPFLIELLHKDFDTDSIIKDDVIKEVDKNIRVMVESWRKNVKENVPQEIIDIVRKESHSNPLVTDEELAKIISDIL